MKKTKIVCTLGPAVDKTETLTGLLKAGMNVARLNFSHGTHEEHLGRINRVREASAKTEIPVAILLDTKGPEIRTGKLKDGKEVALKVGQTFIMSSDTFLGDENRVSVSYQGFSHDLKIGDTILIDDGLIELSVVEIKGPDTITKVLNNGILGEQKGVNLPKVNVQLPALSEKDISDLEFGCKVGIDFVAPSFIRKTSDVHEVRAVLDKFGGQDIKIISKIENQEGLDNFDEILAVSDGIMVARGDLGVEIPIAKIPVVQKEMIRKCNEAGKPVITATQMLESMIQNPRPTRAEVTDVANAILDGTDAIMLSGETAKGAYPVGAVQVMHNIAEEIDPMIKTHILDFTSIASVADSVAKGCVRVALSCGAKAIVVATHTGRSAQEMRKYFPSMPVLAFADYERVAHQLLLVRGVTTLMANPSLSYEVFVEFAVQQAQEIFQLKKGDLVVVSYGQKVFQKGTVNSIRVLSCQ